MKFFAILFLLCAIAGFASASTFAESDYDETTTTTTTSAPTTAAPPAQPPCGSGPQGPCGQKLYFFY
ncbi:uncharacterized protein LOC108117133 isoform X2 [Drosophila eugracilis]|uniref:uncharacterized protein LOC108117133 isoform X2 n=1 Tax=Drosophila eugracilis TaxID=29029 RepID=UPI001BD97A5C|nr:uncharacterized protein LOC108117133 isoform X2 [Drosophila eugracilis]